MKPKIVIETGIDKGLGSILLCSALLKNKEEGFEGHYYEQTSTQKQGIYFLGSIKKLAKFFMGILLKVFENLKK